MNYFFAIVTIGFIIFVHELGHYLAGKIAKIPVAVFSLGFGPKLVAWKPGPTEFRISWIPLGGYVLPAFASEEEYFAIPASKRLFFAFGGPIANILLAVVGFALVNCWQQGMFLSGCLLVPWKQTLSQGLKILAVLPQVFSHPNQLSGVVGIVSAGASYLSTSAIKAMLFIIAISLNLAIINLLPIPGLDGGKIFMALLERIIPRANRWQMPATMVGLVVLMGLMLYTTIKDVLRFL